MKIIFATLLALCAIELAHSQECSETEFACEDKGLCIPNSWICDGDNDCNDMSDEKNCPVTAATPCSGFTCSDSNLCIPASWICDGDNDCDDLSDENECPVTASTPCSGFTCPDSGRCIPESWICDGDNDCHDLSDENECPVTASTPCSGFVCAKSGRCLPESWTCDGENDCGESDFSDETEEACPCSYNETRCPTPSGSETPGACIPQEYICDEEGIWDCLDGSDEVNCTSAFKLLSSTKKPHFNYRPETVKARKLQRKMKKNQQKTHGKATKKGLERK